MPTHTHTNMCVLCMYVLIKLLLAIQYVFNPMHIYNCPDNFPQVFVIAQDAFLKIAYKIERESFRISPIT